MTYTSLVSKGSAAELRAAAWFAERGFHVFRSVSHACPIDLIVYKDRQCFRIEVKAARRGRKGGWVYGTIKHPAEMDGLLLVYPDNSIELKPSPWRILNEASLLSIPDTYRDDPMKCKHGMPSPDQCAICKDWPSLEKMQMKFPGLSKEQFLIMTPSERLTAVQTGELPQ